MTYLAFSFCDLEWWHAALAWLLPALLGLLLGYALWYHWKNRTKELEDDIRGLNKTITGLEGDLDTCHHAKTELDSEVSLLKGQLRERDLKISTLESSLEAANKSKGGKVKAAAIVGGVAAAGLTSSKKSDNLQKIEGVGPKIEKLLNKDDITTFSSLADTKVSKLRKMLDNAGPKFKIAKPDTWPEQAGLARDGKWDELEKLQDYLIGGVRPDAAAAVGGKDNKDDLKKVEGIGPKIEGLMNADGIWTFSELASAPISRLKKILEDAGPRYRIAQPDTWPEQAALARDGKWDALATLQDNLKGGRKA